MTFLTDAPLAQLDRALDYESSGQRFESSRARHVCPNVGTPSGVLTFPEAIVWASASYYALLRVCAPALIAIVPLAAATLEKKL